MFGNQFPPTGQPGSFQQQGAAAGQQAPTAANAQFAPGSSSSHSSSSNHSSSSHSSSGFNRSNQLHRRTRLPLDLPIQVHPNLSLFRDPKECRKLIPAERRELYHHDLHTRLHRKGRTQRPHHSPHREFSRWVLCNISPGHPGFARVPPQAAPLVAGAARQPLPAHLFAGIDPAHLTVDNILQVLAQRGIDWRRIIEDPNYAPKLLSAQSEDESEEDEESEEDGVL
ncbi:hypothetical protein MTO96_038026 [Rhipicephalus appendiculatus]